jgi:hypothetical protein
VKQSKLKIPSTKLQMARAEVLGCDVMTIGGGVVSFIRFEISGSGAADRLMPKRTAEMSNSNAPE